MISRLWELHFGDGGRRARWFILAGAVFLLYALLNVGLLGRDERAVTYEAVILLGLLISIPALFAAPEEHRRLQRELRQREVMIAVEQYARAMKELPVPSLSEVDYGMHQLLPYSTRWHESAPPMLRPLREWLNDLLSVRASIEAGIPSLNELGELQERGRLLEDRLASLRFQSELSDQTFQMLFQILGDTLRELKTVEPEAATFDQLFGTYEALMRDYQYHLPKKRPDRLVLSKQLIKLRESSARVQTKRRTAEATLQRFRSEIETRISEIDDADLVFPVMEQFNELIEAAQGGLRKYEQLVDFRRQMVTIQERISNIVPKLQTVGLYQMVEEFSKAVEAKIHELDDADLVFPLIVQFNELMNAAGGLREYEQLVDFRRQMVAIQERISNIVPKLQTDALSSTVDQLSENVEMILKRF